MSLPGFNVVTTTTNSKGRPEFRPSPVGTVATPGRSVVVYSAPKDSLPVLSIVDDADIKAHEANPDILPAPGGFTLMALNVAPGQVGRMHRTESVDMGVIVSGEIVLQLEDGEEKVLKQGDILLQRAAMHQFKNVSDSVECRMVYFVVPAKTGN